MSNQPNLPNPDDASEDAAETIDARATAFVFGELTSEESIAFVKEMKDSSALQATVESIRDAVGAVEIEFQNESTGIGEAGRSRIHQAIAEETPMPSSVEPPIVGNQFSAQPTRNRLWIAVAAAACLLIIGGLSWPSLQRQLTAQADTEDLKRRIEAAEAENRKLVKANTQFQTKLNAIAAAKPTKPQTSPRSTDSQISAASSSQASAESSPKSFRKLETERDSSAGPAIATNQSGDERGRGGQVEATRHSFGSYAFQPMESEPNVNKKFFAENTNELKTGLRTPRRKRSGSNPDAADSSEDMDMSMGMGMGMEEMMMEDEMMGMSDDMMAIDGEHGGASRGGWAMPSDMMDREGMGMGMGGGGMGGGLGVGAAPSAKPNSDLSVAVRSRDRFGRQSEERDFGVEGLALFDDPAGGDRFKQITDNRFDSVDDAPLSTFSIDVDTAAYSKVRMYLMQHQQLPQPDAVRIEELVNYFHYDYAPPQGEHPFAAAMEVADCPWNSDHQLARIGIKGKVIDQERPSSNLVFLLDVSGSMNNANKLPLVIDGMTMLTEQLTENDSVAIVVYAGAAGMVLDSTTGDKKKTIIDALARLKAGGSTNGGQGIQLAYQIARDNFIVGGTNRVILCSDGDFNVGVTGTKELTKIAADNAKGNIFLSVLGFGMGNHNDAMMEQISNDGNGNYAFIDSKDEAQKVLVDQMEGTLVTIAKDVKIQIEFNPQEVASYRLIGYENRMLAAKDFNDDKKDAGEIGAGHTVTALYEIVPTGKSDPEEADQSDQPEVDELRYQKQIHLSDQASSGELLTLKLRYKQPTGTKSTLMEFPIKKSGKRFGETDQDFQFAASVAAFGMLLRNSPHKSDANFDMVEELAKTGAQDDASGYREEFVQMVKRARELSGK